MDRSYSRIKRNCLGRRAFVISLKFTEKYNDEPPHIYFHRILFHPNSDSCIEYSYDFPTLLGPCDFLGGIMRLKKSNCIGDAIAENYSTGIRTMLPANGKAELLSTGLAKTTSWNSFAESTQGFDVADETTTKLNVYNPCWPGYIYSGKLSTCYLWKFDNVSWAAAGSTCYGGREDDLVRIESPQEQMYLERKASRMRANNQSLSSLIWIGLRDLGGDDWKWNSGAELTWSNWQPGTLNSTINGTCAAMDVDTGKWIAADCDEEYCFICES